MKSMTGPIGHLPGEAKVLACLYSKLKDNGKYTHNPLSYFPYVFLLDTHPWKTQGHRKKEFQ
jgi:hypothetical protein